MKSNERRSGPVPPPLTKKQDEAIHEAYKIFEDGRGRIVLADLCESYYDVETFNENSQVSAFKQGQRSVVGAILTILEELRTRKA